MSRTEYAINAVAWSIVGMVLTLTYQKILGWWRSRQGENDLPSISANAYFGTLLVMFSLVATLFTLSGKIEADQNKDCQNQINRNNVAVLNQLKDSLIGPKGFIVDLNALKQQELLTLENKRTVPQVLTDFRVYLNRTDLLFQELNSSQLYPSTACKTGSTPPANLQQPSSAPPVSTPPTAPSSSTPRKHSK